MERFLDHIEQPFTVQGFAEEGVSAALECVRGLCLPACIESSQLLREP